MRALLTGGTGFIGSAVARAAANEGYQIRVLVRSSSDRTNLRSQNVELAIGDLTHRPSLVAALSGCEALFHLAADYRLWARQPADLFKINVEGTRNLMLAALDAGVRRIVYTSSVATIGFSDNGPATEETPIGAADLIGPYKQSKYEAERVVLDLIHRQGLPAIIVNPSTPVGAGDIKPTPTGRIIVEAAAGRMPVFVDTGLNIVPVEDVARGHLLAFAKGRIGQRYILGGEDLPLSQILAEIAWLYERRPPRMKLPHTTVLPFAVLSEAWCRIAGGEPFATVDGLKMARKRMFFSPAKAQRELGYSFGSVSAALFAATSYFASRGYCPPPRRPAPVTLAPMTA